MQSLVKVAEISRPKLLYEACGRPHWWPHVTRGKSEDERLAAEATVRGSEEERLTEEASSRLTEGERTGERKYN